MKYQQIFLLLFLNLSCFDISGQVLPPKDPPAATAQEAERQEEATASRYIAQVKHVSSITNRDSTRLRLGDHIMLEVKNLSRMLTNQNRKPEELRLFINDISLTNIKPVSCDTMNGKVVFLLDRKNSDDAYWKMFYGSIMEFEYPAKIGIGSQISQLADPYPANGDIKLELVQKSKLKWGLAVIIAMGILMFFIGSRSSLLRNDNSIQNMAEPGQTLTTPFSIAKSQLALWTFLVVSGYFIIWVVTGELPFIPENLLALLGISLTSEIVAKGIDNKQDKLNPVRHQDQPSKGFFTDILSDEEGLSMPRLQFLLFNLVIAASFIRSVVNTWALPNFDLTTLTLLGLSGAGYLAYKTSENAASAPTQLPESAPLPAQSQQPAIYGAALVSPDGEPLSREEDEVGPAPSETPNWSPQTPPANLALG